MLILILIDVQHSWKAVFSIEKGSNHQNHSSSGSLHLVTLPPVKFLIPPTGEIPPTPYHHLQRPEFGPNFAPKTSLTLLSLADFQWNTLGDSINIKGTVTDMRYLARSKFSRSLVHKKNFSLIWQLVFKLGYIFCQER